MKTAEIDATDSKILRELQRNGRATFSYLGLRVGLSPGATAERVRRLVQLGVIDGFHARINLGAVGRAIDAMVDVRLNATADPDEFERRVAELPSVCEIIFVTGRFDYLLRLACRDAVDLDSTVRVLRQEAWAAVTETRVVLRSRVCVPTLA